LRALRIAYGSLLRTFLSSDARFIVFLK